MLYVALGYKRGHTDIITVRWIADPHILGPSVAGPDVSRSVKPAARKVCSG